MVLSQSRHQEKKDAEILAEAKRITEMRLAARRAEEPDVSANENIGLDKADGVVPGRSVSPSSNSQLPATAVAPSTLTMADYASTLASLRMELDKSMFCSGTMVEVSSAYKGEVVWFPAMIIKEIEEDGEKHFIVKDCRKHLRCKGDEASARPNIV